MHYIIIRSRVKLDKYLSSRSVPQILQPKRYKSTTLLIHFDFGFTSSRPAPEQRQMEKLDMEPIRVELSMYMSTWGVF